VAPLDEDCGVSGRFRRASSRMSAGTAPRARATRHRIWWSIPETYMIVMTTIEKTSPRPNMNCHRLPMISRLPLGIDSMM